MVLNCGVREDSWETLGQQGDQTSQSWISIGRTDTEAETPELWPPDAKSWLIRKDPDGARFGSTYSRKDPDAGKDWRREGKRMTADEMVGWHHRFDGHESEQALGAGDGQGSLACCSPWGCKESATQLSWTVLLQSWQKTASKYKSLILEQDINRRINYFL